MTSTHETCEVLRMVSGNLKVTMSLVLALSNALRQQGSDVDKDVAYVLQRYVRDQLDVELAKLAAVRGVLSGRTV